ncbi:hypothetical protein BS78_01G017000 [Paspalum vaginatum]|nr:hypothetical protein BS78_01G017000 [Paspalum vaginatum]
MRRVYVIRSIPAVDSFNHPAPRKPCRCCKARKAGAHVQNSSAPGRAPARAQWHGTATYISTSCSSILLHACSGDISPPSSIQLSTYSDIDDDRIRYHPYIILCGAAQLSSPLELTKACRLPTQARLVTHLRTAFGCRLHQVTPPAAREIKSN